MSILANGRNKTSILYTAGSSLEVIDNVTTADHENPLSANMGKELQDQINNLNGRGRFLSVWDCTTGLPTTEPVTALPYNYKTGDYYIVGTVSDDSGYRHMIRCEDTGETTVLMFNLLDRSTAFTDMHDVTSYLIEHGHTSRENAIPCTGSSTFAYLEGYTPDKMFSTGDSIVCFDAVNEEGDYYYDVEIHQLTDSAILSSMNYRPEGTSYTGEPSTTVETGDVKVNDTYFYDGTQWILLDIGQIATTFESLDGDPYDNERLADALNSKQDTLTAGDNITIENNVISASGLWEDGEAEGSIVTKANASQGGQALGNYAVAEGFGSDAKGNYSHAEGQTTTTNGNAAHAEGAGTTAQGNCSHAEGYETIAQNQSEHAEGNFNKSHKASTTFGDAGNTIHSIGIGTGAGSLEEQDRRNAIEVMQNGDVYIYGVGDYDGADLSEAYAVQDVIDGKQEKLTSGTNIKTINNVSLLGSGNIDVGAEVDGKTITKNADNKLQADGLVNKNTLSSLENVYSWTGTQSQWTNGDIINWRKWSVPPIPRTSSSTLLPSNNSRYIAYGNGKFVENGGTYNQRAAYSTDGITWTATTMPSKEHEWKVVGYVNDRFIAFQDYDTRTAAYSTDGITWRTMSMPSAVYWDNVVYGNGKYIAVNGYPYSKAAYSTNGTSWTAFTRPLSVSLTLFYVGDRFLALADSAGTAASSEDGVNWTQIASSGVASGAKAYGNGMFVSVNYNSNEAAYSIDGINWTATTMPKNAEWSKVAYGDGIFVAVSNSGSVAYSSDGINWNDTSVQTSRWSTFVAYGNNKFVIVSMYSDTAKILSFDKYNAFTTTETPTTSDTVYSEPSVVSPLTITSVGDNSITLSDNQVYNRNTAGDEQTTKSIGEIHPDYLSYIIDANKIMLGENELIYKPLVDDVKVNGVSVVSNGVATIPLASSSTKGVVSTNSYYGTTMMGGYVAIYGADDYDIEDQYSRYAAITPSNLSKAVMEGLGNNSLTWTDAYKQSARTTINAQENLVSGTNIKSINDISLLGSGNIEIKTEIASEVDEESTNNEAVGAKLFYDTLGTLETTLDEI